jgi:hypothetical protein
VIAIWRHLLASSTLIAIAGRTVVKTPIDATKAKTADIDAAKLDDNFIIWLSEY